MVNVNPDVVYLKVDLNFRWRYPFTYSDGKHFLFTYHDFAGVELKDEISSMNKIGHDDFLSKLVMMMMMRATQKWKVRLTLHAKFIP